MDLADLVFIPGMTLLVATLLVVGAWLEAHLVDPGEVAAANALPTRGEPV